MHELAIAQNILDLANEEMRKHNCKHLQSIDLQCGLLCGVDPEALQISFQILIQETAYPEAKLEIELVPAKLQCPSCDTIFLAEDRFSLYQPCPNCQEQLGHKVLEGRELLILKIDAE